jgi:hypothetical protein
MLQPKCVILLKQKGSYPPFKLPNGSGTFVGNERNVAAMLLAKMK